MALRAVSAVGCLPAAIAKLPQLIKTHPDLLRVLIASYVMSFAVFIWGLGFNMFRSDAVAHWRNSFDSRWLLFSTAWIPGYFAAIALVKILTFDSLRALAVMWPFAATFYVASSNIAYQLFCELGGIQHPWGFSLVYAVFPFVGLTGAGPRPRKV